MITVVTGPPCSGKSTYVREHARPGDVVIDLDALFAAMGSPDDHDAPYAIWKCAIEARDAAVDAALDLVDVGCDVWIVHTDPGAERIYDYISHDARFVDVDADRETCIARAKADGRPQRTIDAIDVYFKAHEE